MIVRFYGAEQRGLYKVHVDICLECLFLTAET